MDAATRKLADETSEERFQFASDMLKANPEVSHSSVNDAAKKRFGVGIDFYTFKEMRGGKKPKGNVKRDPNATAHKKTYKKKEKFARKMLAKHPMSFVELNKLAQQRIGTNIPIGIYRQYYKKDPFKEKVANKVKADLKVGTSPLKTEKKKFEKVLLECGIQELTMKVIDGVAYWHVVEKREYDL